MRNLQLLVSQRTWTPTTSYTVYFNAGDGRCSESSRSYPAGPMYGGFPPAYREGYWFNGWWTSPSGGVQLHGSDYPTYSRTVYAHWEKIRLAMPGRIELVDPDPLEAKVGTTARFWFAREGGSDGRIAVKVKTQTSTAVLLQDLGYVNKTLVWADGDSSDKYLDVPVYATGAGKQFRFKLSTLASGSYAGYAVPYLPANKIYVPIVGATPGMIAVSSSDPLEAEENSTFRVWFSRFGGSEGSIAVKVKSQTSTATLYSSATPWGEVGYVKKVLTWADGETDDKYVDVPIYSNGAGKQFRLKLSTLATGLYAGNLVPKLEQAKIYVPIVE